LRRVERGDDIDVDPDLIRWLVRSQSNRPNHNLYP
jgi:hypothetical protein